MKDDNVKKKKRRLDGERAPVQQEDEVPRKKKKKKERKTRTPEMAQAKLEKRRTELDSALESIDIEKLSQNLQPGEREYLEEYVWMFNRIGRLIRKTEESAMRSGQSRDIYALSTLISQQREIIADIRTLSDMSGQINLIRDRILQPMSSGLAQNILDSYYQLRSLITATSSKDQTQFALGKLDDIIREQSRFLQVKYSEATERLNGVMTGDVSADSVPGKKKKRKKAAEG